MKKKISGIIVAVVCIGLVVGLFYYATIVREQKNVESASELTEIEKVLTKDLEKSYPMTPREVVTFYNRILGCLYNEKYTEEQFENLAMQLRQLLSEELLDENPQEVHLITLKNDIANYELLNKKIATTSVAGSAEVQKKKVNGKESAYVTSSYFIKEGESSFSRSKQCYVLQQDDAERWKIVGFYLVEGENFDD